MELIHLHIFQWDAPAIGDCHAVAHAGQRVAGDAPGAAIAAGRKQHNLGVERMDFAVAQVHCHDARHRVIDHYQVQRQIFIEETHLIFDGLLEHGLENHMAGAVGGIAGAPDGAFAIVARVPAEAALVDAAIGHAIEGQAPMFQVIHRVDGFAGQHLGGVLVREVVATLHGVEHVPFPVIFFDVAQRGSYAALRRASVRACGIEFRDDGDAGVARKLAGRHQSRAARANDHHIEFMICHKFLPSMGAYSFGD